jgi:hypothetical protein
LDADLWVRLDNDWGLEMGQLTFSTDERMFDGKCVRFVGLDGGDEVLCGVTVYAMKHHHPDLPVDGLLPAELFLKAYDEMAVKIHAIARQKYAAGQTEQLGPVAIMVHDTDWQ